MISIAIDGPAGAGKSSVAKELAKKLSYIYVDTGALYRAVGYFMYQNDIDTKDADSVVNRLSDINVELKFIDNVQKVFLNDEDVSEKIRLPEISMCASNVSAIPKVREFLFDLQRDIAAKNNIIMDGRDIGTVVLPNAQVKIFLTADAKERAKRRYTEFLQKGQEVDFDALLEEIKQRDYNDSHRAIAPLKQAEDAVLVDTTDMDFDTVVKTVTDIIDNTLKNRR